MENNMMMQIMQMMMQQNQLMTQMMMQQMQQGQTSTPEQVMPVSVPVSSGGAPSEEVNALKAELEKLKSELEATRNELKTTKSELQAAVADRKHFSEQHQAATTELNDLKKTVGRVEAYLGKTVEEIAAQGEELSGDDYYEMHKAEWQREGRTNMYMHDKVKEFKDVFKKDDEPFGKSTLWDVEMIDY